MINRSIVAFAVSLLSVRGACAAPTAPRLAFAVPEGLGISTRLAHKPLDPKNAAVIGARQFRLAVAPSGDVWFIERDGALLIDDDHGQVLASDAPLDDFVWMDGGDRMACSGAALGVVIPSKEKREKSAPRSAHFAMVAPLASGRCRLFSGGSGALYVLMKDAATGGSAVFLLSSSGLEKTVQLVASREPIAAVAGDGRTTFVASGKTIYRLSPESTAPRPFFRARKPVTALAYSPKTGLFYATAGGVGFADPKFSLEFLKVADPEIVLHGSDLYVRLAKTFAVLAVTGADHFQDARWPASEDLRP